MWSGALPRGPEGRLGLGKTGGAAPGVPQEKMLPGSILVLMPALPSGPPGPRGGVASEVGPGGKMDPWTRSLRSQGHKPTRSHALHTHILPGHMGTAGAPDSPTREGPGQQRAAATRPQHSHTHAQTSHGLGPTVGAEDLSWESALRTTPSLGFLAQYGGQESPILLQGWPRQENSSGGGWTDRRRGGQSRLCSAS